MKLWPTRITITIRDWKCEANAWTKIAEGGRFNPLVLYAGWRRLGIVVILGNHLGDRWRRRHPNAPAWTEPKPPEPGEREKALLTEIKGLTSDRSAWSLQTREMEEKSRAHAEDAESLAEVLAAQMMSEGSASNPEWQRRRDRVLAQHYALRKEGL